MYFSWFSLLTKKNPAVGFNITLFVYLCNNGGYKTLRSSEKRKGEHSSGEYGR